jgi:RimJ/RimL family protein N-acetyltransferase
LDIKLGDTRHARLRAWRHDDLDDLVANADPSARFPYPYSGGDGCGWLDAAVRDPCGRWALELDSRVVGGVSLIAVADDACELGYWLGRDHWQRGIMTRVVAHFAPEAMREFRLHRLVATAYADNPASMCVLEKAGFAHEGMRKSAVVENGQALELVVYVLKAELPKSGP